MRADESGSQRVRRDDSSTDEHAARRREIAHVAARLFAKNGFAETGMDDIAAVLEVSKPTLYYYVRSKGELLFLIHDELIDLLTRRLEQRLARGTPASAILRAIVEDTLRMMETHPGHLRVFVEHFRSMPDAQIAAATIKRDRYFALVKNAIAVGIDSGEFAFTPGGNADLATFAVFGMVNWSYQWYRPGGELPMKQVADTLAQLLLGGLGYQDAYVDRG